MNETASNQPAEDTSSGSATDETVEDMDPVEAAKARVRAQAEAGVESDDDEEQAPPASPLEFLNAQINELEAEKQELKDRMLRAYAEAENTRKRAMRDREEAQKFGGTRLARDLLAVYDNLERALKAADEGVRESAPDFIAGVELTQRELLNAFAKHEIDKLSPEVGDRFDPNLHQAMFEAPVPSAENGSIIEVMQPGFTIAGRLLRAAMVGVAKNPGSPPPKQAEADGSEPAAEAESESDSDTASQT